MDSALFVEVKRLFSTVPEVVIFSKSSWIETEANGGHWGDRTLNRTRSRLNRTRLVSSSCYIGARARVLHWCVWSLAGTGASGQALRGFVDHEVDRTRSVASGPLLDSNRTLGVTRPISSAARLVGASRAQALCMTCASDLCRWRIRSIS
jgi:hypothetical protein